jgi:hypothetical protein
VEPVVTKKDKTGSYFVTIPYLVLTLKGLNMNSHRCDARCFQVPPISSVAIHISPRWGGLFSFNPEGVLSLSKTFPPGNYTVKTWHGKLKKHPQANISVEVGKEIVVNFDYSK